MGLAALDGHRYDALREAQCRFDCLRHTPPRTRAGNEAIHPHVQIVRRRGVERDLGGEVHERAVERHPHVAFPSQRAQDVGEIPHSRAGDGRENGEPCAHGQGEDLVHDLRGCVPHDGDATRGAPRATDPREEEAEKIVRFGQRGDGGTRAMGGRTLGHREGRRQPLDGVHVGPREDLEGGARIQRQRIDEAALRLGVERVEGEAGLARS